MNTRTHPDRRSREVDGVAVSAAMSIAMLKAVVSGETYEAVATRFGRSRTAVERRIKSVAIELGKIGRIQGLNAEGAAFVRRLRIHREAVLVALESYVPAAPQLHRDSRIVTDEEISQAAMRIACRSGRPRHDVALFYVLFATGARPLEIARLEVRDYLNPDGSVRRALPKIATSERICESRRTLPSGLR